MIFVSGTTFSLHNVRSCYNEEFENRFPNVCTKVDSSIKI